MYEKTLTKNELIELNNILYELTFSAIHEYWTKNVRYVQKTMIDKNTGTAYKYAFPSMAHVAKCPYWEQLHIIEKFLIEEQTRLKYGMDKEKGDPCLSCHNCKRVHDGKCFRNKIDNDGCDLDVSSGNCPLINSVLKES